MTALEVAPQPSALARPGLPATPAEQLGVAFLVSRRAGNTRDAYRRDLLAFLGWCTERDADPLTLRRLALDTYRDDCERQGLSAATVARRLSVVSAFYTYLVEEEVIGTSPMARVRRPKVSAESTTLGLDKPETERMLRVAASAGPRDHALARLMIFNGLRVSEVCGADVADLGDERDHRVLAVTRKGGGRTLVPLAPATARAVAGAVAGRVEGPLLLGDQGRRLNRQQAATIVARLARTSGIRNRISPHSLRHTWVTMLLELGVSLRDVQRAAGHVDPKTTIRYDRARVSLDNHPTYALAQYLAA